MIQNNGLYISATERDAFESLKIGADANNTTYYVGSNFDADTVPIPLQEGQSVDVSFDTLIVIDGEEPTIILQGKKYPRGFREGLQSALTPAQMAAVNSGVTAEKVAEHDAKQNALSNVQLAAVNSGITATKRIQYDGYANGKQNKLTSAQLDAVNSGITSNLRRIFNDTTSKVNAYTKATLSLRCLRDKKCRLDYLESENSIFSDMGTATPSGSYHALISEPFTLDYDAIPTIDGSCKRNGWKYYFVVNVDAEIGTGDVELVEMVDDDSPYLQGSDSVTNSIYYFGNLWDVDYEDYEDEATEVFYGFYRYSDLKGCEARIIAVNVNSNDVSQTDANSQDVFKVTVANVNNFIEAYNLIEQNEIKECKDKYFTGKLWKGEPNSPDAREVDMYYAQRSAIPTYKAKKVGDNYVCVPIADADNTYDLYVAVLDYDHIGHSYISLTAPNGAFIAEQTDNFTNDGSITVLGNPVFNPTYTGNRMKLIVSPTDSCVWYEANETIADVLKREIDYRELLSAEVAALTSANSLCTWKKYDAITGDNAYPNFTSLVSGNTTAWQIDDDTLVGNIEIDATKGNRIFDFRNLKDANDEPIPVNFVVNIAGFTSYETIIFFKGIDVYSISPTSPLAMSSLCFCGEEPDLDTEKEYVLSIQGNTLIFGELNRGVDAETEEE